jgi:hypothetical protein
MFGEYITVILVSGRVVKLSILKKTVSDPLLFLSGSARNRTRASGSVAKNSDH